MVDVSKQDLSTTVLGHRLSMPIMVAPTAMQKMAHPEGECTLGPVCFTRIVQGL